MKTKLLSYARLLACALLASLPNSSISLPAGCGREETPSPNSFSSSCTGLGQACYVWYFNPGPRHCKLGHACSVCRMTGPYGQGRTELQDKYTTAGYCEYMGMVNGQPYYACWVDPEAVPVRSNANVTIPWYVSYDCAYCGVGA